MRLSSLSWELWLARPREEVFAFFSDARSLERITPPWLGFEILTRGPLAMSRGTLIDYRLRWHGIPLRWQSEITVWEPPHRFVDEQRRGPYRFWRHEHTFSESRGGTVVGDLVEYAVYGGPLVARLFVQPDLKRIFSYRHERLKALFEES